MNLTGIQIIDTGVYDGAPTPLLFRWTNESGKPMYVKIIRMFMGMRSDTVADYFAILMNETTQSMLFPIGWDHYTHPTAPSEFEIKFSPDHVVIAPGDTLVLVTNVAAASGPPKGHVAVRLWYHN